MDLRFFEIYRNPDYLWRLADGLILSVGLTVAAALMGMALATALAILRHARVPYLHVAAACYVEFTRNTPLIVQLFFVAFGLPLLLGYQWPFWGHALLALSLNFSAYFAEILRAGFATVPLGQLEAASALGLSRRVTFAKIVLPQAIARMAPSINSQFIFLFLTTGVISEIGVRDLTEAGVFIDSRTFRSFEVFLTLTAIYILLSLVLKSTMTFIQSRAF
ncbi:MAG: amino acid ABC transporter permease, partial [Pseudomonadota bacterium]